MQKHERTGKRLLALVLALVMALSTVTECLAAVTSVQRPVGEADVTMGKLLAEAYSGSLTDSEKALLKSGYLAGDKAYVFTPPAADNSNGLVTIDKDSRRVTASSYKDGELMWTPVEAAVIVAGKTVDNVQLVESSNSGVYAGVVTTNETSYSVAVKYRMYITVDQSVQNTMLGAGKELKDAVEAVVSAAEGANCLEELLQTKVTISLECIQDNIDNPKKNQQEHYFYEVLAKLNKQDGGGILFSRDSAGKMDLEGVCGLTQAEGELLKKITDDAKDSRLQISEKIGSFSKNGGINNLLGLKESSVQTEIEKSIAEARAQIGIIGKTQSLISVVSSAAWNAVKASLNAADMGLQRFSDFDHNVVNRLICTDLTAHEGTQLDALVNAVSSADAGKATATGADLLANETLVTADVAQATVKVVFKANVFDKGATTTRTLSSAEYEMRVDAGKTESDIKAELSQKNWADEVLNGWNTENAEFSYNVGEAYYDCNVSVTPVVEAAGLEDGKIYIYTVTYTPKTYAVTAAGCDDITDGQYGYGYTLTLPKLETGNQVYDYTVNGVSYDEGSVYRVVGNTVISRVEGKAWEEHNLGKLLYENYAKDDTYAGDILTNTALNTGVKRLRTPSAESGLLHVENSVVTAATYGVGGGSGLMWLPKTATPVAGGAEGTPVRFVLEEATGKYTAVVAGSFDRVLVQYELTLDWDNLGYTAEETTEILNLPYTLTVAAKRQLEAMDDLAGQYGQLAKVNDKLSMINTQIVNDTEHNISAEAVAVWKDVYANNVINKQLIIFPYIGEYAALTDDAAKLTYYYKNAAVICREMDDLCSKLVDVVLADAGVQALVKEADEGIFNDLQKIQTKLREVNGKLGGVDDRVNIASPSLRSLTEKVVAAIGKTTQYATVAKEPVLSAILSVEAPGKIAANITVEIKNSAGETVGSDRQSVSFKKDEGKDTHKLTQSDITALENALNAALNTAGSGMDLTMYQRQENTGVLPQAGDEYAGGSITVVYEPRKVSVTIEGVAAEFYVDDPEVELPPCSEDGFRYDYTVDGTTVSPDKNNKYRFSAEQVQRLLRGETITIARSKVDIRREAVLKTVDALNAAVAKRGLIYTEDGKACLSLAFIPVEKNGAMTILVRISPDTTTFTATNLKNLLADVANELMTYSEVKLSGGVLWDDELVYLQALVDTLLDSGFGMDTVLGIVDENGGIKENSGLRTADVVGVTTVSDKSYIQVGGYYVPLSDDTMGGVLLNTDSDGLVLDGKELSLCVTLEDFDKSADTLKKMRDNLAKARDSVNAWLDNGTVNVNITAPDKAYKAFLTGLLALGESSIDDISNFSLASVETLAADKIKPVLENEAITGTTIQNTLTKLGITTDVSRYTELYDKYIGTIRTVLKAATVSGKSGDATTFNADVSYPVKGENGITSLMGDNLKTALENAIAENALSDKLAVTLDGRTPAGDYAAIVVGSGGVSFLTDLNTTIEKDTSLVVLLKDCSGTLRINGKYVYVDLRGHTFSGDIIGTEQYKANNFVVDSILDTNGGGTVTGKVQNMVLAGGSYKENKLTGCEIRNGYTMENGLVSNQYYTIEVNGSNINVTLKATAQSLRNADKYTVAALAGDLASDLLLNYYSTAQKVTVDGHTLYNAAVEDITTLFQNGKFHVSNAVGNDLLDDMLGYNGEGAEDNYDGVNYMIGSILDALLDFQNLADSIGSNNAAVSYSLTATAWDVTVDKAESGDYLAIGITGSTDSSKTKRQTLNVFLNSDSEKNNEQLKNALEQLAGIIEVDVADKPSLSLDRITLPQELGGKTVQAKLSGSGHVTVKISDKPVYAALMAITVANSLPASDSLRAELKNAVETFYNNNDAAALKTAMEKVTCAQVFAALKTVGLRTNFLQMAISVGFGTDSKTYKAISESYDSLTAYRGGMAAAGWLLKQLNINGNGATLAGFEKEFGIYEYAPDKTFNKTATVSGDWKVNGVVSMENAKLTLELFAEDNAILVTDSNGKRLYNGDNLNDAIAQVNNGGVKLTFHKPVTMTGPVDAITKAVTIVNADKLTQGSFSLALGLGGSIHADSELSVMSADAAYYVKASGHYLYELVACEVTLAQANGSLAYYHTVEEAAAAAENDAAITVNGLVRMTADVAVSGKTLTIRGVQYIVTNDHKFQLSNGSKLVADGALTVVSGEAASYVLAESSNGTFTYTLKAWEVTLTKNGANSYFHTLEEAVASASNGATITVNSNVTMSGNVNIGGMTLTIKGAAKIAQGSYQFLLNDVSSKLIADSASLNVELGLTGKYTLVKRTDNGMTTYSVKEKTSGGGGGGGGSYTGNYIYLDVQPTGINAKQLQTAVRKYFNDSNAEVTIYSGLTASGLVANGASIYVSGSRAGSYTVIIMGDTNCNGKTDSGDAVKMRNHYFGTAELTGVALEAADMNRNGKVDSGDAVKNRVKYQGWRGYRSELKITV